METKLTQTNEESEVTNIEDELQDSTNGSNKKSIWIISLLLHSIVIASLAFWFVDKRKDLEEEKITTIEPITEIPEEIDISKKIDVIKEKVDIKVPTEVEMPNIITPEVIADHVETENDSNLQTAEGVEEAISDSPQVGIAIFNNIGGGSGQSGSIGNRKGAGKKRALVINGGNKATESSVRLALMWLAQHQEKDGHWDSGKYEGGGTPEVDSAVSGAALLAFLGAGYTDKNGEFKTNVKSSIKWLLETQKPNGSWDARNYANGICTMAIAEAVAMGCGGSEAKKSAELAVDYLLKQQNKSGCFDYTGPSSRDDMSVTGWCIMGLKSALLANIKEKEINDAFHKCGAFLDITENTKDNTSTSAGLAWYTPGTTGSGASGGACQAIAMLVRQYLGWERSSPWLQAAAEGQISKIPVAYEGTDIYRVYYSFLTLFQQGGKHWKAWNEPVSKMIVAAQRQDGDFKGSWDKNGCHVDKGGRVLYTAFLCLTLEIYYRYQSITK